MKLLQRVSLFLRELAISIFQPRLCQLLLRPASAKQALRALRQSRLLRRTKLAKLARRRKPLGLRLLGSSDIPRPKTSRRFKARRTQLR